jgi:putative phage-type endonuclease
METHLIQGSEIWKAMRLNKIGASDAPIIMQISPFCTPYQLWTYKMGVAEPQMNSAMSRGVAMEEEARQAFNLAHNVTVVPKVYFDDVYPWMMASLDGVSEDGRIVVEIKCPGIGDHLIALEGRIPEKYWPQLQHQLYITGLPSIWYCSYRSPNDHTSIKVYRDDEYIEKMLEKEKEFYRCMTEFDPPALVDRDYQDLGEDKEFLGYSLIYIDAVKARKEAEESEEWAKKKMIAKAQGNAKNNYVKLTKYHRKGSIEYGKIEALKAIDLEQYRKPNVISYRISEVSNGDTVTTIS